MSMYVVTMGEVIRAAIESSDAASIEGSLASANTWKMVRKSRCCQFTNLTAHNDTKLKMAKVNINKYIFHAPALFPCTLDACHGLSPSL